LSSLWCSNVVVLCMLRLLAYFRVSIHVRVALGELDFTCSEDVYRPDVYLHCLVRVDMKLDLINLFL